MNMPNPSFHEYIESQGKLLSAPALLRGDLKAEDFDMEKLRYLQTGGNESLIKLTSDSEINTALSILWEEKIANIKSKLFKSEYLLFEEFLKHLALDVGDLFKADKLAKLLGSSRRKVYKYIEILDEAGIILHLNPFYENTDTELSRHEKIFFSDLAFLHAILGPVFYFGDTKKGIMENFIFLELRRKLDVSHEIFFYRKKSQAELSFILKDNEHNLLTPVDVVVRSTDAVSQAVKTFDTTYHDRVERYMILDEHIATQKTYNDKAVFFLPHIAI